MELHHRVPACRDLDRARQRRNLRAARPGAECNLQQGDEPRDDLERHLRGHCGRQCYPRDRGLFGNDGDLYPGNRARIQHPLRRDHHLRRAGYKWLWTRSQLRLELHDGCGSTDGHLDHPGQRGDQRTRRAVAVGKLQQGHESRDDQCGNLHRIGRRHSSCRRGQLLRNNGDLHPRGCAHPWNDLYRQHHDGREGHDRHLARSQLCLDLYDRTSSPSRDLHGPSQRCHRRSTLAGSFGKLQQGDEPRHAQRHNLYGFDRRFGRRGRRRLLRNHSHVYPGGRAHLRHPL